MTYNFAFAEVTDSFRLKNEKEEGISPLAWYANQKEAFINKQKTDFGKVGHDLAMACSSQINIKYKKVVLRPINL